MSGSGPIYEYQRELTAKLEQVMRERDEARKYAEERNDEANKLQRLLNMAAQKRDELQAEVKRLRADLNVVDDDLTLAAKRWEAEAMRAHNLARTVAEKQREACAAAVDAHGVRSEWGALVRATPLVTEAV